MAKRKQLTKEERHDILEKYHGKCAYCGTEIRMGQMQIDHVVPICLGGRDSLDNMLPTCSSCNGKKDSLELEEFRAVIENLLKDLESSKGFKIAMRYGLVAPTPHPIEFHFEKLIREGRI